MGAFELGLNHSFDRANTNLAYSRQLQDEQRQQNLQRNWSILNDPNSTDDVKQAAGQDIQNQYPTPEHKGTFLSDILHIHAKNQAAQAQPPAQTPSATQPLSPTQSSSAAPAPVPPATDQLGVPYASGPSTPPATTPAEPASPPQPLAAVKAAGAAPTPQAAMDLWKQYRGPVAINEDIAKQRASAAAGFAQNLESQRAAAGIQEATIRAHGNVSMQKLDAAAQSLGAEDFSSATPDVKMQAMKNMASANRAPAWKSVTDGNSIYAVNSLDPTRRTLLGHKDDLTQRQEFRTMTNPDGSTFLVPVTVWSKKGSSTPVMETQDEQGGAPVSASTPQGPGGAPPASAAAPSGTSASPSATPQTGAPVSSATPQGVPGASANPGARQPGSRPAGGAVKASPTSSRIPSSSVGAPIPFGGKPSELTKSDTSQYTKLAEDANDKQKALDNAQIAMRAPSPSSDQQLIYSWVRTNVQGAGRMTQSEFKQAGGIGSVPMKFENWLSLSESGKMTPQMRQMMFADIQRNAQVAQQAAGNARTQVQQDMNPSKPTSSKTPKVPGGVPKSAADYLKSIGLQ